MPEELPADFAERRVENYGELRKPLDPAVFVEELREELRDVLTPALPVGDDASG